MADKAVKQSTAKGGASAADLAARPFQCEWHKGCAKSFNRKSDLQRHYRIHTNERPYACDCKPCNKTFIQRSALTVHRRTHTGDKPHKCPFLGCGKCFSDSSSLARHRRIHTNDKPYICRNQRCKKAFCRKTTMTKHIRKEHPTESTQEDQDAEYSDVEFLDDEGLEDESDEIKEEPQDLYSEPMDAKEMHLSRRPSEYSRNLWPLPGQAAHRPVPLHIERSTTIPRSKGPVLEIKLERTSSSTPQRSLTDPYPDGGLDISDYSLSRSDTMPNNVAVPSILPQSHTNGSMTQPLQFRNPDSNLGLWSSRHAMQDSPTSLTHSSPSSASTQSHSMFTSQPYQLQPVDVPSHEQLQYSHHHDVLVSNTIQQPLSDMTVHEIHLDEPQQQQYSDMAAAPVHQNQYDGGIQQHVSQQEQYIAMSRKTSQHNLYDGPTPRSAIQQYRNNIPATPTPTQQLSHYTNSFPDAPYQQPFSLALGNLSTSNQVFPSNDVMFQYNNATNEWWKDTELEEKGWILPNQRVPEFDQWGS